MLIISSAWCCIAVVNFAHNLSMSLRQKKVLPICTLKKMDEGSTKKASVKADSFSLNLNSQCLPII